MIDDISNINGYETKEEARSVIMKDMFEENDQVVICEY
jgi:chromosomal replication initiation ATPase DnaA